MKLKELINIVQGIAVVAQERLPTKTAFRLGVFVKKSSTITQQYDETRRALVKRYGEAQENGDVSIKDPGKLEAFNKELDECLNVEIDAPKFEPKLTLEDFGECQLPIAFFAGISDLME